jgi:tripartite-type tricarboxylate transporter receptor subunit TctC
MLKITMTLVAAVALAGVLCSSLRAEDGPTYPQRPVTLVVQAAPGGGNDALARIIANQMQKRIGQPVVVENRPGGGGAVGSEFVARSKPDGYTLLLLTTGETYYKAINPAVQFDTTEDFSPITLICSVPLALVSKTSQPFKSLQEFVAYAKANPKKLSYGSAGVGSPHHLTGEMLNKYAGIDVQHVPYRGTAPAINDLLSGEIAVAWSSPTAVKAFLDNKTLQLLAVADSKRSAVLPTVPTVSESGYPDVTFDLWFGIVAPKGTPAAIVKLLDDAIRQSAHDPETAHRLQELGFQLILEGPDAFAARIQRDQARYTKIIGDLAIGK